MRFSGAAGLAGLTAVTSWVVSSISVWLVPVYIGAMVLIFAVPRTNSPKPAREDEAGEPSPTEDPTASSFVDVEAPANVDKTTPAPAAEAEAEAPPAPEAAAPKPRKRRVRAKKTAKGVTTPDDALASGRVTWVRVGPGKFVRSVVPVAEFVGPPAPASIAEPQPQPPADIETETETETKAPTDAVPDTGGVAVTVEAEVEVKVEDEVGSAGETGLGERDGSPAPVPFAEALQPSPESPSTPDAPPPALELGPDEESSQDPLMDQDDSARGDEASEGPAPSTLVATADVEADGFAIENEHETESTSPDVSEAIAEEHGNTPSTLGEDSENVPNPRVGQDEESSSVVASPGAAEAVAEVVEVDHRETVEPRASERSSPVGLADSPAMEAPRRRARLGLFFSASLRRSRRTIEPSAAVPSPRLGNVRRSGETRVRHFAEAVRGRRVNVKRDFQPRSPPVRS